MEAASPTTGTASRIALIATFIAIRARTRLGTPFCALRAIIISETKAEIGEPAPGMRPISGSSPMRMFVPGILNSEFAKTLKEVNLGRPRGEALMAMAERNGVDEMTAFIRSVVQAEPLGVSIAQVLEIQADEQRRLRRQRAEEAGHRAPVLMLLPMMGCIFPCIFIMLLGPAILKVFTGG